jgi:RNA polymerase sigma-70 factor (ECF subfamily)
MMDAQSDAELVEEVRKGNRRAFSDLMRRYQQRVYWTARRIMGNHEDADDVAQETFVKAYLALGDFRGDGSLFTWLYRIAVNLSINALRKRQLVTYVRDSELLRRLLPATDNPASDLEHKETLSALDRAVGELPEKQKAVFVLRFFDGMSYEEISKILKTSVGGLKANYFHALNKVQEAMRREDPDEPAGG